MAQNKVKVGIIFGGQSKEREISFAGGRTVYDNLSKSIFEAIPIFVDSFGNFVELNWEFIYKGTIRDFYPPVDFLPTESHFQYYAENLGALSEEQQNQLLEKIGTKISVSQLKQKIEFAFLCLHGPFGEDGRIQGLFEYYQIPYSGSGVLPSAIGIDKSVQKQLMVEKGFNSPKFLTIDRDAWIHGTAGNIFNIVKSKIGFPCVIKPANQGSSIGITILKEANETDFMYAVEKALFTYWLDDEEWKKKTDEEKINFVKKLTDIREGIGMPILVSVFPDNKSLTDEKTIYSPDDLLNEFNANFKSGGMMLQSLDGESTVLVEGFIEGKEFSCIVLENEKGTPIALPPTEIRKGKELFDYRSKYLPGLSRKITPIDLPDAQIEAIRKDCERLFVELKFDVYARIDGFLSTDGKIFLNDPNTTSGMMPSSFFFHQAAEIGLSPSEFLTFIISTSLTKRINQAKGNTVYKELQLKLENLIHKESNAASFKTRIAVILGGYSSERHISVESGRNVYEKLASSEKYFPIPVFLCGSGDKHELYQIPINLLLKDNADDIKEKIYTFKVHPLIQKIKEQCASLIEKYSRNSLAAPVTLSYDSLAKDVSEVFIALHGRPGEDGAVQEQLDKVGLSYNGSNKDSSSITIDKYRTNEILKQNGYLIAEHLLISEQEWSSDKTKFIFILQNTIKYPFIAKPVDDGCSSAVKKIKSFEEFEAFAKLMFRTTEELDKEAAEKLHIKDKEEFPQKRVILVEELISKRDAKHFLEVTGGMLTKYDKNGELEYEVFEASEALAGGEVLSLEEKFLAGQGQNITPARYAKNKASRDKVSEQVKIALGGAAKVLGVSGYCRIDAFVRVFDNDRAEIIFIEVNSLPGMTPATCIFHQAAINNYKPFEFIDKILEFGVKRKEMISA